MKHVVLFSVKQIQGFEKKKEINYSRIRQLRSTTKITLDAAKFKRRIATYRENTEKKIHK